MARLKMPPFCSIDTRGRVRLASAIVTSFRLKERAYCSVLALRFCKSDMSMSRETADAPRPWPPPFKPAGSKKQRQHWA